jgi:hypothetical protein
MRLPWLVRRRSPEEEAERARAETARHEERLKRKAASRAARHDAETSDEQVRHTRAETRRAAAAAARAHRAETLARSARWTFAGGVNACAAYGQYGYFSTQAAVAGPWAVALATLAELAALNVQWYAHQAYRKGRPVGSLVWLFGLSYLVAAGVAWMNYTHWDASPHGGLAVPFAAMSLSSALFWHLDATFRLHEARQAARAARGLRVPVEHQYAAFGAMRWLLAPGETFRGYRRSVLDGVPDSQAALEAARDHAERKAAERRRARLERDEARARKAVPAGERKALPAGQGGNPGAETPGRKPRAETTAAETPRRKPVTATVPETSPGGNPGRKPSGGGNPPAAESGTARNGTERPRGDAERNGAARDALRPVPGVPDLSALTDPQRKAAARDSYRKARAAGRALTGSELGEAYGRTDSWGRARIREVDNPVVISGMVEGPGGEQS